MSNSQWYLDKKCDTPGQRWVISTVIYIEPTRSTYTLHKLDGDSID